MADMGQGYVLIAFSSSFVSIHPAYHFVILDCNIMIKEGRWQIEDSYR